MIWDQRPGWRAQLRFDAAGHPVPARGPGPLIISLVLSCALGVAYAFLVAGPRVLNPLDVSWLIEDPATAYLGWGFFRQETHLALPLGWSGMIGYPLGEPIAYFDSMPMIATIGWLARGLLPSDFQYLGIYFALCCVLQFYFGCAISRRLCRGSIVAGALGGCLFLTASAFTWRALGHFALASHWLLLAALEQLILASARPSRRQVVWQAAISFIAGGTNPYIAVMTLLIFSGAYLRTVRCQPRSLAFSCVAFGILVAAALLALALFGFIRSGDVSQYAGGGYGIYSMNLLAPIDPESYGALVLKAQAIGAGQYEGYNYLGLGLILLGIVAVARRPQELCALLSRDAAPVRIIFIVSLLLALSLQAKAGTFTIWNLSVPYPIIAGLAALRASGRLFWPAYYLLFIGTIALAARSFSSRALPVALGIAVVVNFVDLAPLRGSISRQWTSTSVASMPAAAAWHDLGLTQQHLIVHPAWQCSSEDTPGGAAGYIIFGRLALEQHMTINSFYAARYSAAQTEFFCKQQMSRIQHDGLHADFRLCV